MKTLVAYFSASGVTKSVVACSVSESKCNSWKCTAIKIIGSDN